MNWLIALLLLAATVPSAFTAEAPEKGAKAKAPSAQISALATSLTPSQHSKLMYLLNYGHASLLMELPGLAGARAAAIIAHRPYAGPLDVLKVPGIGEATLTGMLNHARAGFYRRRK